MSLIRNKYLKRSGLQYKSLRKKCRKSVSYKPKCNIRFFINNFSFSIGLNDVFVIQSTRIK